MGLQLGNRGLVVLVLTIGICFWIFKSELLLWFLELGTIYFFLFRWYLFCYYWFAFHLHAFDLFISQLYLNNQLQSLILLYLPLRWSLLQGVQSLLNLMQRHQCNQKQECQYWRRTWWTNLVKMSRKHSTRSSKKQLMLIIGYVVFFLIVGSMKEASFQFF